LEEARPGFFVFQDGKNKSPSLSSIILAVDHALWAMRASHCWGGEQVEDQKAWRSKN